MSTRSVIARKTGENTWLGRYHHSDGYPSGVGQTLYEIYHDVFGHDIKKMLHFLIEEHPAGWSSINGCTWELGPDGTIKAGFVEHGGYITIDGVYQRNPATNYPHCYCHGDRHDGQQDWTNEDDIGGLDYLYLLDEDTNTMQVFDSLNLETPIFTVNFEQPAPDWDESDAE